LAQIFGVLGHMWSQNDVIMPWLRFTTNLKLLPVSILDIHKVIEHIDMLSIGIWWQPYIVLPSLLGSDRRLWASGSHVESK